MHPVVRGIVATLVPCAALLAQAPAPKQALPPKSALPTAPVDSGVKGIESRLHYQNGTITIGGDIATLRLPPTLRFLDPAGAKVLLEEGWGNPPGAADGVLGMIVPAALNPLDSAGWAVVVEFKDDGYVDDKDAATIDYAKLLKQMQDATAEENVERRKQGYEPVTLVGWAEQPTYDAAAKKMYWAKELQFGTQQPHTLNYNVRVLGRRGVLELNAVADMSQLATIRKEMQVVLPVVEFNSGHRYAEYQPGTDKAAAYGVAGLVAGAVAAKAGLFKGLIALLLAAKKLIVALAIGGFAAVRRFFSRDKTAAATGSTDAAGST